MGLDRRMQCFIDQLFPIIWSRYLIPEELTYLSEPSGLKFREISPALVELLSKAIWVQSKIAFHHWVRYLRKYYDEMVSSPKMFVTYVTYACNTMAYNIQDHYERFVTVCALLVGFGANFHYSGNGEVLRYIPQILAVFFERVMLVQFYDRGGWKRLDKYLLRQEYLDWHDEIQIDIPNETPQLKILREFNFAKRVELAIQASACKDYDVDGIREKDVECDLVTVQITDEVMRYFSETSPTKKGSKKLKYSAISPQFDEAAIEAKKNVSKGMMELVQRARLDALLKSRRLEESSASSGTVANVPFSEAASNVHLETGKVKQPDSIREESACKRQKTKKQKVQKTKDGISNIPQFIEKTYEVSVESGGTVSNIVQKTGIIVIQKPDTRTEDSAGKPLKTKKKKTSKVKVKNIQSSPLSVENVKNIMNSGFGDNNESVNPAHKQTEIISESTSGVTARGSESAMDNLKSTEKVTEDKCIELIEDDKLCIVKIVSDSTLKDNSESLKENECTSNQAAIERSNQLRDSNISGTNESFDIEQKSEHINTEYTLKDEETRASVFQKSNAGTIGEKNSDYLESEEIRPVRVSCIVRGSKAVPLDSNTKGNDRDSDREQSIERNIQSETPGLEDINDSPENSASSFNTSQAKFKTKHEAMNAIIKIVDNLAPKIEKFVDLLDSLVWDLKKES